MIPVVISSFGTLPIGVVKGLEKLEVGGRAKTIQATALLRSAKILRRVLETCCHSNFNGKPSANAGVKNSQRSEIIIIK